MTTENCNSFIRFVLNLIRDEDYYIKTPPKKELMKPKLILFKIEESPKNLYSNITISYQINNNKSQVNKKANYKYNQKMNVLMLEKLVILIVIVLDVIIQVIPNLLRNYRQEDVIVRKQVVKNILRILFKKIKMHIFLQLYRLLLLRDSEQLQQKSIDCGLTITNQITQK